MIRYWFVRLRLRGHDWLFLYWRANNTADSRALPASYFPTKHRVLRFLRVWRDYDAHQFRYVSELFSAYYFTLLTKSDMVLVQDGVGQKISLFITGTSMFFSALIVGFIRSWKLTLIMLSATLAIVIMMGFNGAKMKQNQTKAVDEYATAGTLAEEVISSARNVTAYGTQKRLEAKYKVYLDRAAKLDYNSKFWLSSMVR